MEQKVRGALPGNNPGSALATGSIEVERGEWNAELRGEMCEDSEE